jgi:hypothetical protein
MRKLQLLVSTATLLAGLVFVPMAYAQVSINIGIQPTCPYGYYGYAPYSCAPVGYYGSGYFYNGIFVGMGPWAGWGYGHGWGSHRFVNDGGGRYHGGIGRATYREPSPGGARANNGYSDRNGGGPNHGRGSSRNSQQHGDEGQGHSGDNGHRGDGGHR